MSSDTSVLAEKGLQDKAVSSKVIQHFWPGRNGLLGTKMMGGHPKLPAWQERDALHIPLAQGPETSEACWARPSVLCRGDRMHAARREWVICKDTLRMVKQCTPTHVTLIGARHHPRRRQRTRGFTPHHAHARHVLAVMYYVIVSMSAGCRACARIPKLLRA